MKTFNFTVDITKLNIPDAERPMIEAFGQKNMFEQTFVEMLMAQKPQMGGAEHRVLNRILDKLDSTVGTKIDLEEAEFDMLSGVFDPDKMQCSPVKNRLVMQYVKNIEQTRAQNSG